jgi:putative glutamine amidotransferase
MKPLIGITTGTIQTEEKASAMFKYGQSHTYVDAITQAGGIPVLIPIALSREATSEVFERLDGIVFSGGNDLEPGLYNKEVTLAHDMDAPRDTHEVELMKMALAAHKPVLGICRGMQLLNVVRGGSLYQDIMTEAPGAKNHDGHHKDLTGPVVHTLAIVPDSNLAKVLGTAEIQSNSYHHQAVKDVGEGLVVSAYAEDGIIEGIEDMSEGFVMAVQPHPESIKIENKSEWNHLFKSFIAASVGENQRYSGLEKSNLEPASHSLL